MLRQAHHHAERSLPPEAGLLTLPAGAHPVIQTFNGARKLSPPSLSDLVRAAQRGDRTAMQSLYERFAVAVHGCLLAQVAPQDADDLVQDVFAAVFDRLHTLREPAAFPGWIISIARNLALAQLRAPRRRPVDTGMPESTHAGPDTVTEADEVLRALAQVSEKYREVLILRLVEGMTGPEIAESMGLTHGTVRVYLHEGMQRLRAALAPPTARGSMHER